MVNWEDSGLTWSVTGKEEEGHSWPKLPFPVFFSLTEYGAAATSHGPMKLLD